MQRHPPHTINSSTGLMPSSPSFCTPPVFSKSKVSVVLYRKANRRLCGDRKFSQKWMICVNLNPSVCPWGANGMTESIVYFMHMNVQSLLLRELLMYYSVRTRILNLTASIYYSCWIICYCCMGTLEMIKSVFPSISYSALCFWRQWKRWHTVCVAD